MKVLAVALALLFAAPALAQDKPERITVGQSLSLLAALRNLDGRVVVVKQNGADVTVVMPWDFASGSLRLKIATDITILAKVEKTADDARQAIVREIIKGMPPGPDGRRPADIKPASPEMDIFSRQFGDLLAQPADGTERLVRIKSSELKLDKNEIPVTALSAMEPILDADK